MKLFIIGLLLHFSIIFSINDATLITSLLYHYKTIDIRFLISLLFNIYYLVFLYHLLFKYLDIEIPIKTRLNTNQRIIFILKRISLFTLIYLSIQIIIMFYTHQYPITYIFLNLWYYYVCLLIAFLFLFKKDFIYPIMIITITLLKLL